MSKWQDRKDSAEFKKEEERKKAQKTKEEIENTTLVLSAKAGDNGKIFGAITSKEIAEELLKQKNIVIDKKKITIENIKNIGEYTAQIKLFEKIIAKLKIIVK